MDILRANGPPPREKPVRDQGIVQTAGERGIPHIGTKLLMLAVILAGRLFSFIVEMGAGGDVVGHRHDGAAARNWGC